MNTCASQLDHRNRPARRRSTHHAPRPRHNRPRQESTRRRLAGPRREDATRCPSREPRHRHRSPAPRPRDQRRRPRRLCRGSKSTGGGTTTTTTTGPIRTGIPCSPSRTGLTQTCPTDAHRTGRSELIEQVRPIVCWSCVLNVMGHIVHDRRLRLAGMFMRSLMIDGRTTAASRRGRKRLGAASSDARTRGSPASMSTILVRLEAPETRRTELRRTPNEPATAASAASVALPSTARALTRTTRAPSCSPPTPGGAEPGLTRIVIRI